MEYAGFWKRFVAYILDYILTFIMFLIVAFIFRVVEIIFGALSEGGEAEVGTVEYIGIVQYIIGLLIIELLISWLYWALMESSPRQATLGKRALGIIVTDLEGDRISFGRATGRYFAKIISALILLIGFIMAGFTAKKQALHDMIASTLVVMKR